MIDTGPYTHDGIPVANLLEDLVDTAANALAETPDGRPTLVGVYHAQPAEDCCDALQLWVREWVPVVAGQFPVAASAVDICKPIEMTPRIVLSLRRPCEPETDAMEQEMAARLIVDQRALACGIGRDWPALIHEHTPHGRIMYGNSTAQGANTSCHGWDWDMMVELKGCRVGCGQP